MNGTEPAGRLVIKLLGLCVVAGVLLAGMVFPFAAGAGIASNTAADTMSSVSADLADEQLPSATTVTDSAGTPIAYLYDQNRTPVSPQGISPAMKAAMVAIEDRRFYDHQGVDWQGTVRALIANSASGDVVQGASTLTQQYVKNYQLYVTAKTESDRLKATEQTTARKLREVRIALQLERKMTKEQILAGYLNIVFLGNNAYGVAEAARTYFNTTADRLTVPQAAMLAGMVRSTSGYDPVSHPQAALDRRNLVIRAMAEQGMISAQQAAEAAASPLGVVEPLASRRNGCLGADDAGYFCKYVVEYLTEAGFTAEQLNRGGYVVRTTLDPKAMQQLKIAVDTEVPPKQPHVANVMAMVAPGTTKHKVLAMGANRTFGLRADQEETSYGLPYQPVNLGAGSIYKIFTAATALEKGLGINYNMEVPPSGYASPIYKDGAGRSIPVSNDGRYPDHLTMQQALAQSPNTAFVKLEEFTGVAPVVDMAVRMGMRSLATTPFVDPATGKRTKRSIAEVTKAQNLASFTLGVSPTSILELANVGATLGSAGTWCPPSPIDQVTGSNGAPVPITELPCERVLPAGLANTLLTGMSDDHINGTAAAAAKAMQWTRPLAGKTGTTQQYKSAGFVGIVPQVAGAVITFDNSRSPRPLCDPGGEAPPVACSGGNIYGGKAPARTFYLGMNGYLAGQPVMPLPPTDPRYTEGGEASRVPDVIGKNADDARKILSKSGWKTSLKEVDNRAPEGKVVGQSPRGTALPGEVVTLQVSTGEVPPPPPPPGGDDDRDSGYNGVGPDTFGQGGGTAPSAGPALPNQSGRGPGG
ncbi:MAG TPA: transglycosylase domain-containing protein [Pseudonocardia sp.]|uniref:transglycosylase domain-containing protein n=1 Tax=Pseudonocardia sp. TaxID=60912 RepID=UPI002CF37A26|nr:transglycosylase domain-containing protein [Pseudonocardia sp.]HTF48506.1 transglycosylase domain-containing protein [Pseudonocardia sp.]